MFSLYFEDKYPHGQNLTKCQLIKVEINILKVNIKALMATKEKIRGRLHYFKMEVNRGIIVLVFVTTASYLIWLASFPAFGPVADSFLENLKALTIEKGRFVQMFLLSMALSSSASGYLIERLRQRMRLFWASTLTTSLLTFAFLWLDTFSLTFLFALLLGLVAGVTPCVLGGYFSAHVPPEDRGRAMSLPVAFSLPAAYLFLIMDPQIGSQTRNEVMIVASICLIPLITIFFKQDSVAQAELSVKPKMRVEKKQIACYSVSFFLFYWVAGILFSIVIPTIRDTIGRQVFYLVWAIPFLFGTLAGGILLDSAGRKFPTIIGLAVTGVSLAVFGVFGLNQGYLFIVPLSVGFSFVLLSSLIAWADLAPSNSKALYYGLGVGLMSLAAMLGLLSAGTVFGSTSASQIKSYILFSAVALFLCIPPLIIAEDLLPRDLIEKRRMKEYLEQARRKYVIKE